MSAALAPTLWQVYRTLLATYGPQRWWPAEGPFEVVVGAVLTQNTAWTNVERAIDNLRGAGWLSPEDIAGMAPARLAELLRPSGYFNVKARRLQAVCAWLLEQGGMERLAAVSTPRLRRALLTVNGVGRETADDILLYAFGRPVFVIDAYTRRLLGRMGLARPDADYEELRGLFEEGLGRRSRLFNEYHALIVRHAKEVCRPRPRCDACPLRGRCPTGAAGRPGEEHARRGRGTPAGHPVKPRERRRA